MRNQKREQDITLISVSTEAKAAMKAANEMKATVVQNISKTHKLKVQSGFQVVLLLLLVDPSVWSYNLFVEVLLICRHFFAWLPTPRSSP
jgi:hypothetical protein